MTPRRLSAAEDERLTNLEEECAEVIAAICKVKRHGWKAKDGTTGRIYNNRADVEKELGDLIATVRLAVAGRDVDCDSINARTPIKLAQLARYTHHQRKQILDDAIELRIDDVKDLDSLT